MIVFTFKKLLKQINFGIKFKEHQQDLKELHAILKACLFLHSKNTFEKNLFFYDFR
jgi:hypothetical protein